MRLELVEEDITTVLLVEIARRYRGKQCGAARAWHVCDSVVSEACTGHGTPHTNCLEGCGIVRYKGKYYWVKEN